MDIKKDFEEYKDRAKDAAHETREKYDEVKEDLKK